MAIKIWKNFQIAISNEIRIQRSQTVSSIKFHRYPPILWNCRYFGHHIFWIRICLQWSIKIYNICQVSYKRWWAFLIFESFWIFKLWLVKNLSKFSDPKKPLVLTFFKVSENEYTYHLFWNLMKKFRIVLFKFKKNIHKISMTIFQPCTIFHETSTFLTSNFFGSWNVNLRSKLQDKKWPI